VHLHRSSTRASCPRSTRPTAGSPAPGVVANPNLAGGWARTTTHTPEPTRNAALRCCGQPRRIRRSYRRQPGRPRARSHQIQSYSFVDEPRQKVTPMEPRQQQAVVEASSQKCSVPYSLSMMHTRARKPRLDTESSRARHATRPDDASMAHPANTRSCAQHAISCPSEPRQFVHPCCALIMSFTTHGIPAWVTRPDRSHSCSCDLHCGRRSV
jgi:hypothetical protein